MGILAVVFLIGQRFNATWAGGDGYVPNLTLESSAGELVHRGETVSTDTDEHLLLTNELIEIALDQNTDLEIITLNEQEVELYLHRGRLGVRPGYGILSLNKYPVSRPDPIITVRSDYIRSSFESPGQVSFVYYDFMNKVSIIPFDNIEVTYSVSNITGTTSESIDISELEPYTVETFEFKIPGSAAEEFYYWLGWE
ncbi:MAG: hypothetical protein ABIH67_03980 [Candidatus Uhrbacteria bacterium]